MGFQRKREHKREDDDVDVNDGGRVLKGIGLGTRHVIQPPLMVSHFDTVSRFDKQKLFLIAMSFVDVF